MENANVFQVDLNAFLCMKSRNLRLNVLSKNESGPADAIKYVLWIIGKKQEVPVAEALGLV